MSEYDGLEQEYKKLKAAVEQLRAEYEQSKDYDFVRRYGLLKGMIKRTVVHLRLSNTEQSQGQSGGLVNVCKEYANAKEKLRKREEKYAGESYTKFSAKALNAQAVVGPIVWCPGSSRLYRLVPKQ